MKFNTIFVIAVLLLAFSTQTYAHISKTETSFIESLGMDMQKCVTNVIQALQLGYQLFKALKDSDYNAIISIVMQAQTVIIGITDN